MKATRVHGAFLVVAGVGVLAMLARAGMGEDKPPVVAVRPSEEFLKIRNMYIRKDQVAVIEVNSYEGHGTFLDIYLVGKERAIGRFPGDNDEGRAFLKALGLPPVGPEAKR